MRKMEWVPSTKTSQTLQHVAHGCHKSGFVFVPFFNFTFIVTLYMHKDIGIFGLSFNVLV